MTNQFVVEIIPKELKLENDPRVEPNKPEVNDFMGVDTGTVERNKAVTLRFMEEFKNQHNFDVVDELFSPHAILHLPAKGLPNGAEGQKAIGRVIFEAFPDVHVTLEYAIAEGDLVAERHTARATHKGEFMGIPATGKKIHWTENHFYRLESGKIRELWSEWSYQNLMDQISHR